MHLFLVSRLMSDGCPEVQVRGVDGPPPYGWRRRVLGDVPRSSTARSLLFLPLPLRLQRLSSWFDVACGVIHRLLASVRLPRRYWPLPADVRGAISCSSYQDELPSDGLVVMRLSVSTAAAARVVTRHHYFCFLPQPA